MSDGDGGSLINVLGSFGSGKGLTKLLEVLNEQFNAWRAPRRLVAMARAEAEAKKVRLTADFELHEALEDRAVSRELQRAVRSQRNVEAIVAGAVPLLPADSEVQDAPVDGDWAAKFFRYCEDVSDRDMQGVWSRILSQEVASPGSFSPRALNTVSLLSRSEAEAFTAFVDLSGGLGTES